MCIPQCFTPRRLQKLRRCHSNRRQPIRSQDSLYVTWETHHDSLIVLDHFLTHIKHHSSVQCFTIGNSVANYIFLYVCFDMPVFIMLHSLKNCQQTSHAFWIPYIGFQISSGYILKCACVISIQTSLIIASLCRPWELWDLIIILYEWAFFTHFDMWLQEKCRFKY